MNELYFTRVVEKTRGLFTDRVGGGGGCCVREAFSRTLLTLHLSNSYMI